MFWLLLHAASPEFSRRIKVEVEREKDRPWGSSKIHLQAVRSTAILYCMQRVGQLLPALLAGQDYKHAHSTCFSYSVVLTSNGSRGVSLHEKAKQFCKMPERNRSESDISFLESCKGPAIIATSPSVGLWRADSMPPSTAHLPHLSVFRCTTLQVQTHLRKVLKTERCRYFLKDSNELDITSFNSCGIKNPTINMQITHVVDAEHSKWNVSIVLIQADSY
jgi:hypothetical protein